MTYSVSYEYEIKPGKEDKSKGKGRYKTEAFNLQEALTIIAINCDVKIIKVTYVEVSP